MFYDVWGLEYCDKRQEVYIWMKPENIHPGGLAKQGYLKYF